MAMMVHAHVVALVMPCHRARSCFWGGAEGVVAGGGRWEQSQHRAAPTTRSDQQLLW